MTEGSDTLLVQYGSMLTIGVAGTNLGDGVGSTGWAPATNTAYLVAP